MRGFTFSGLFAALLLVPLLPQGVDAQDLPLKRDLPPLPESPCAVLPAASEQRAPPAGRRAEAERLASQANQAAILGDHRRARTLLRDAWELDPTSPTIAYRLGRVLEDDGERSEALGPYCRYLELAPDGPDADDVRERVERIADTETVGWSPAARAAFQAGIEEFDRGDYEGATRSFSRAVVEHPDWAEAHYNRGLAQLRLGRRGAGGSDLERYLELSPEAGDAERVASELRQMQPAVLPTRRAGTVLMTGMVVPGMGHFYSGRPAAGFVVLAAAGTAAGVGLFYREVEVRCRSALVNGQCPPDQIAERIEEQPLLVPALAAAGVITIAGAVHAYLGARRTQDRGFAVGGAFNIPLRPPGTGTLGNVQPVLLLEPGDLRGEGGLRAGIGVRF